jgi:hydrocephalus-inducing protein
MSRRIIEMPEDPRSTVNEDPDELVKVVEILPEPEYRGGDRAKDIFILASGISDYISYQISHTELGFGPTMMFDGETQKIQLKNTSQIRLEYTWRTMKFDALRTPYASMYKCPFSVMPVSGIIEAGKTTEFTVAFIPEEVDDFTAVIRCDVPLLTLSPPPELTVTGFSRRPICHFNAELSDYLSAGRRRPDYVYPLPDGVKVIEMLSTGVGVLFRKKFEIINTTHTAYEIIWKRVQEHTTPVMQCEVPRAFIPSGHRHVASFTYKPTSVKAVESLWTFTIKSHEIEVPFLIIGRIMRR